VGEVAEMVGGQRRGTRGSVRLAQRAIDTSTTTEPEVEGDLAVADHFYTSFAGDVRYLTHTGCYYLWDETRFRADGTESIIVKAEQAVRDLYTCAAAERDQVRRDRAAKLALSYSKIERISGALRILRPRLAVSPDDLDSDPYSLCVANGVVDLRTGELREHRQADLITKLIPIKYDPNAAAPRFYRFLSEIFADDLTRAEYVKRSYGYSLSGAQTHHALFLAVGAGANGKSTLLDTLLEAAGGYGQVGTSALLVASKSEQGQADPEVAQLRGVRFVLIGESAEGGKINEQKVKALTGGENLSARFLYKNPFEFRPSHHLWLMTNHKPRIRGSDHGIWRRLKVIPFNIKFENVSDNPETEHPIDPNLRAALVSELPGILKWGIEGAREFFKNGLDEPETIKKATAEYRSEEDVLEQFITATCVVAREAEVQAGQLHRAFVEWAQSEAIRPWSTTMLGRRLKDCGYEPSKGSNGRVWRGIGLRDLYGGAQ
jgi:putative DNA primase/helicase